MTTPLLQPTSYLMRQCKLETVPVLIKELYDKIFTHGSYSPVMPCAWCSTIV